MKAYTFNLNQQTNADDDDNFERDMKSINSHTQLQSIAPSLIYKTQHATAESEIFNFRR